MTCPSTGRQGPRFWGHQDPRPAERSVPGHSLGQADELPMAGTVGPESGRRQQGRPDQPFLVEGERGCPAERRWARAQVLATTGMAVLAPSPVRQASCEAHVCQPLQSSPQPWSHLRGVRHAPRAPQVAIG